MKRTARIIIYVLAAVIALVLVIVYYKFDPSASIFFPRCPFQWLTNLPCAGCGSQRALHSLLHLDFAQAIKYNFLVVAILPFLALLAISSLLREKRPGLYRIVHHKYVGYAMFVIVILWWILRIVFHWYV